MKAVFIGCVISSERALSTLLECDGIEISGVVTRRQSAFNADFRALKPLCASRGIPVFFTDGADDDALKTWISGHGPDVCFCIGWSYLLSQQILDIPKHGVIGYHPALLPRGRGRHPIIWALALGLKETGSTFFVMDRGADSGNIVSQMRLPIDDDDDAGSLYERLLDALEQQLRDIAAGLAGGTLRAEPQDHAAATYWRKRSRKDGEIDWRMPADGIRNLVRALADPYPGAHCVLANQEIKVHKVETTTGPDDIEPGCVIDVDGDVITVKAGIGAVRLTHHGFTRLPEKADYLI